MLLNHCVMTVFSLKKRMNEWLYPASLNAPLDLKAQVQNYMIIPSDCIWFAVANSDEEQHL